MLSLQRHRLGPYAILLALACGRGAASEPGALSASKNVCAGGVFRHPEDLSALAGCRHVSGDVALGGALVDVRGLDIESIAGNLTVGPSYQLTELSGLDRLTRVGGGVVIRGNLVLGGVFLGALQEAGRIEIQRNPAVANVSLHRLQIVHHDLQVMDLQRVFRIDLSALRQVGGHLELRGNPRLEDLTVAEGARVAGRRSIQAKTSPGP